MAGERNQFGILGYHIFGYPTIRCYIQLTDSSLIDPISIHNHGRMLLVSFHDDFTRGDCLFASGDKRNPFPS